MNKPTLTAYQSYRSMSWTTDADKCENDCGVTMSEEHYVEGRYGHYCGTACKAAAEDTSPAVDEARAERRQMGFSALD